MTHLAGIIDGEDYHFEGAGMTSERGEGEFIGFLICLVLTWAFLALVSSWDHNYSTYIVDTQHHTVLERDYEIHRPFKVSFWAQNTRPKQVSHYTYTYKKKGDLPKNVREDVSDVLGNPPGVYPVDAR